MSVPSNTVRRSSTMQVEEPTIFRTPRRQRRNVQREGNVCRRRNLFSESKDSDDDISMLSPTSSEVGSPSGSPVIAVKNLESNFNQLLLDRTPGKSPVRTPTRFSPRIKGVRCLSENTDIIKTKSFYGGRSIVSGSVDGKSLLASVRSAVPLKARTRLFVDDGPKETKKRARTASFLDSAKRAKKKPRLQESIPVNTKSLIMQKLNRLKARFALDKATKRKKKLQLSAAKPLPYEMTVYADKKSAKKEAQSAQKRKYNWEIFSTGNEKKFFRSFNSSVTMTPPATSKKKRLMGKSVDFLHTPPKNPDFSSDGEDETEVLIEEIKKDVREMIAGDEKEVQAEVDSLLLQLENPHHDQGETQCASVSDVTTEPAPPSTSTDKTGESEFEALDENCDPNAIPSTPSSSQVIPVSTPSTEPKLFPVFLRSPGSSGNRSPITSHSKKNAPPLRGVGMDQMLLDCGQSTLREIECPLCHLVYVQGVPEDEAHHLKYHSAVTQMKYQGLKNENIVGLDGGNKVILIRQRGEDPRVWKKALDYKRVADAELGAPAQDVLPEQVYLYICNKQVVGLLCAVSISEAHRLLSLSNDVNLDPNLPSLCSEQSFPAKCGITRIWVSPSARKQGVATAMTDALRRNFLFGSILNLDDIAMSSPTADGRLFGFKYFKRNDFLVY